MATLYSRCDIRKLAVHISLSLCNLWQILEYTGVVYQFTPPPPVSGLDCDLRIVGWGIENEEIVAWREFIFFNVPSCVFYLSSFYCFFLRSAATLASVGLQLEVTLPSCWVLK